MLNGVAKTLGSGQIKCVSPEQGDLPRAYATLTAGLRAGVGAARVAAPGLRAGVGAARVAAPSGDIRVEARITARGLVWDVDGAAPLAARDLRRLARDAGLPGLSSCCGPWRDGARGRQRVRVSAPAAAGRADHRVAARALGLMSRAGAWTPAGEGVLEALRDLVREEAAALGLAPHEVAPAALPIASPSWLLDEEPLADSVIISRAARSSAAVAQVVVQVVRLGGRLALALGLTTDEVVVTGGDAELASALADARVAPLRRRPGTRGEARVRLRALDRLGRSWTMAWLCVEPDGAAARGAVGGGAPRALALVLEQLGGALPPWLAPEQVRVLPVGGGREVSAGARALVVGLQRAGLRAGLDDRGPLAARVGAAAGARLPYMVFVGPDEVASDAVRVRARGATACARLPRAAFVAHVTDEVSSRRQTPLNRSDRPGARCAGAADDDVAEGRRVDSQQRV